MCMGSHSYIHSEIGHILNPINLNYCIYCFSCLFVFLLLFLIQFYGMHSVVCSALLHFTMGLQMLYLLFIYLIMSNVFDVLNLTCSTCCTKMYYIINKMAYSTVCNKGRPLQKIFSRIYHWLDYKDCSYSPDVHEFIRTCKAMKEHCL